MDSLFRHILYVVKIDHNEPFVCECSISQENLNDNCPFFFFLPERCRPVVRM